MRPVAAGRNRRHFDSAAQDERCRDRGSCVNLCRFHLVTFEARPRTFAVIVARGDLLMPSGSGLTRARVQRATTVAGPGQNHCAVSHRPALADPLIYA